MLILNLPSEKIGAEMYELLTMANQTTEDVFSLLDNLLKWTKSQIGKLNVVYQDVDLVEVTDGGKPEEDKNPRDETGKNDGQR